MNSLLYIKFGITLKSMKKIIVLTVTFIFSISIALSQENEKEELYLELVNLTLTEKVFDVEKFIIYQKHVKNIKDTCFFYGRRGGFIENTEKCFEFTHNKLQVYLWPMDHIIFYDFGTHVMSTKFSVKDNKAWMTLVLCKNDKSEKQLEVYFKKRRKGWKIRKVKTVPVEEKYKKGTMLRE